VLPVRNPQGRHRRDARRCGTKRPRCKRLRAAIVAPPGWAATDAPRPRRQGAGLGGWLRYPAGWPRWRT